MGEIMRQQIWNMAEKKSTSTPVSATLDYCLFSGTDNQAAQSTAGTPEPLHPVSSSSNVSWEK